MLFTSRKSAVAIKNELKDNYVIDIHVSTAKLCQNLCGLHGRRTVKIFVIFKEWKGKTDICKTV